jgi:uncharacterized protein with NRDE domain
VCTLTLAWQVFEDSPVIVAANRDELLDRPAELPAERDWETRVVAPKDAEADGTWIGYNEHGVLVAITNRWMDDDVAGERSRGLLVRDALGHETTEDAIRYVENELDERTYDGFNLLAADAASAILVEYDGLFRVSNLGPGVHVIVNVGADGSYEVPDARAEAGTRQAENANSVRTALEPEPGETGPEWLERAGEVIGDHQYGVCVHADKFGTRSSSLIRLGTDGVTYEFADGPPCETAFESVDASIPVDR